MTMGTGATQALPRFDVDDYGRLIDQLRSAGWVFELVREAERASSPRVAFLRHDVDFHLDGILPLAEAETARGVQSTWYILLSGPYNPVSGAGRSVLRRLHDLGHDIGLHYDLSCYAEDIDEAEAQLDRECAILGELVGAPVRTICMHQPGHGGFDPFRALKRFVHPHGPASEDQLYVSDSCRAWRDEALLACLGPPPPTRLLLNTHPELWLDGSITSRFEYLDRVVRSNISRAQVCYIDTVVRSLWETHPGALQHDQREAQQPRSEAPAPKDVQ